MGADHQRAPSVPPVGSHQRMLDSRKHRGFVLRHSEADSTARKNEIMLDRQVLERRLLIIRQLIIRDTGRGKLSRTTGRRYFSCREDGAKRRHRLKRAIRVPQHICFLIEHPPIICRNRLASLDIEVGLTRKCSAGPRIERPRPFQDSEPLAEGDLLRVVNRLVRKDQDRVFIKRRSNFAERRIAKVTGNI